MCTIPKAINAVVLFDAERNPGMRQWLCCRNWYPALSLIQYQTCRPRGQPVESRRNRLAAASACTARCVIQAPNLPGHLIGPSGSLAGGESPGTCTFIPSTLITPSPLLRDVFFFSILASSSLFLIRNCFCGAISFILLDIPSLRWQWAIAWQSRFVSSLCSTTTSPVSLVILLSAKGTGQHTGRRTS
jgi:hypothetical protein